MHSQKEGVIECCDRIQSSGRAGDHALICVAVRVYSLPYGADSRGAEIAKVQPEQSILDKLVPRAANNVWRLRQFCVLLLCSRDIGDI